MRFALAIGLVMASILAGCRAPLEGAPCPCIIGFVCGESGVCEPESFDGADSGSPVPDAASYPDGGFPDSGFNPDADLGEPDADVSPDASLADAAGFTTDLPDE
jgi:hypothetical protein